MNRTFKIVVIILALLFSVSVKADQCINPETKELWECNISKINWIDINIPIGGFTGKQITTPVAVDVDMVVVKTGKIIEQIIQGSVTFVPLKNNSDGYYKYRQELHLGGVISSSSCVMINPQGEFSQSPCK